MNPTPRSPLVRVVLIEDFLGVRRRQRSLIEESGRAEVVGEAHTDTRAMALIRATAPDAVVLNLNLADGVGCGLLSEIKSAEPSCLVIVLTDFTTPEFRALCLELGADHFLDKTREFGRLPDLLAERHRALFPAHPPANPPQP
ncbi:MAG: response regulator transcription factor [Opitutae bacterium]|nr:response regulator transcription factor [Opitutae bacterium]